MPSGSASRWTALGWGLAFAATLLFQLGDADVWWHVRSGQWIWEHGVVPTVDPFSHTADGPWRYTEALAQLLLFGAHAAGAVPGLAALHLAVGALLGAAVARLASIGAGGTGLVVGAWGAASLAAMTLKPQIFSYLLFAVELLVLREAEVRARAGRSLWGLAALPLLFLTWVQLHRGGVLGLAVVGAAIVAWAQEPSLRSRLPALAATFVACVLASTTSSGGLYYVTSAFDVSTRHAFEQLAEWAPLDASTFATRHLAVLPLLGCWLFERARSRRRVDTELLVVIATGALFLRSGRLAPFFAMALVPGAAATVARAIEALARRTPAVRPGVHAFAAGALGVALLAGQYTHLIPPSQWGVGVVESRVPVRLAAFLRENPPGGRMWNSFDLGGYLLFALAPEQKVFIDGRNDTVYDAAFFRETLEAPSRPELFARQLVRYDVGYVAARSADLEAPALRGLGADPGWALVYLDDVGAIFVRRDRVSAEYLRRHAYVELRPAGALRRAAHLGRSPADQRFAADVARLLARNPESIRAHYLAALLARSWGDRETYAAERAEVARRAGLRDVWLPLP